MSSPNSSKPATVPAGNGDTDVSMAEIQELLARGVRLYAEKVHQGHTAGPFPAGAGEPATTDVVITVWNMLEAINLSLFELGLWHVAAPGHKEEQ